MERGKAEGRGREGEGGIWLGLGYCVISPQPVAFTVTAGGTVSRGKVPTSLLCDSWACLLPLSCLGNDGRLVSIMSSFIFHWGSEGPSLGT